jgi:Ser/Thr protein kinase RdoA (MazF antagonist)
MLTHSDIARAFGFQLPAGRELESIYSYAPVYRLSNADGDWVLKRTQKPLARGRAVAAWEKNLAARGPRIVTPAPGFGDNPRIFNAGDDSAEVWVVYPFITGSAYTGDTVQIGAAGSLLGEIHAHGAGQDFGLKRQETAVAVEPDEIEQDIEEVLQHVGAFFPRFSAQAGVLLAERRQRYFQQSLPKALETQLPLAVCSWDYKASNLVYQSSTSPVLVDADNAACIPRLYDLAIAVLLFHNEGRGPCRLFTAAEWAVFLGGYLRHVQFTDAEKKIWNDLLLCAWMDEGLWLLQNDESGWADPPQAQLLLSLLITDLSGLALPD